MTRREVADRSDVNRETVRYYEQCGIIPDPPRTGGGYRSNVERICFIKRAQELGFSLKEIKELLEFRLDPHGDCGDVRAKATAKLADVRDKLHDLQRIETVLDQLSTTCGGEGPTNACPILNALGDDEASRDATS